MNKTKVTFIYDEATRKWEVEVTGVVSELEARQAFVAVVLTAKQALPHTDFNKATLKEGTTDTYKISVGQ